MEAEARRRPELGSCLAGKYEVERLLGEGSMGAVYAARNVHTGKRVAIKWMIAERQTDFAIVDRFRREARAAGRIDHPNVVTIFDVGNHESAVFLVMEMLSGEPLSDLLMRGPLATDEALGLLVPVLRGVAAAHAAGVVHRDLKPENIFLCQAPDGSLRGPKVLDFGISKLVGEAAAEELRATRTGVVIGTPTYMSPEQIAGARDVDERIDVYALGVMLYEMLAGRPPFMAGTYTALVVQIATATPPDLRELRPDLDPGLVRVIQRAMARDRDERFPDIEAFAEALEPFSQEAYRPEAPAWSHRVSTRKGSTKLTATGDGRASPSSIRPSAPTLAGETMESGLRASSDAGPVAGFVPGEATDQAPDHPAGLPVDPRRLVLIGAAVGLALLGLGLAIGLAVRGSPDENPPPTPVAAPESAGAAPAADPELPTTDTAPSPATNDSEPEWVLAEEPAAPVPPDGPAAELPDEAPAAMAARRRRVRRPPSMTAASTEMGRAHRAGTLSVEDF